MDGPRAGDRLTDSAFSGPDRSVTIGVEVEGDVDHLDFHWYTVTEGDWTKARWAGFVRRGAAAA